MIVIARLKIGPKQSRELPVPVKAVTQKYNPIYKIRLVCVHWIPDNPSPGADFRNDGKRCWIPDNYDSFLISGMTESEMCFSSSFLRKPESRLRASSFPVSWPVGNLKIPRHVDTWTL
jgi:hypothetical protein